MRKTKLFKVLKMLYRYLRKVPRHPIQNRSEIEGYNICFLGSDYGGWEYVDTGDLWGSTIISAGLGEDASFDVEFAAKYNARVVIVDPTPRSIEHFNEVKAYIGQRKCCEYSNDGRQPIGSYDLESLEASQLQLVEKALWDTNGVLKFYMPDNVENVSHSVVDSEDHFGRQRAHIEVEAVSLDILLEQVGLSKTDLSILKLDIEGAEIDVLAHCMKQGIYPQQILVEYDTLTKRTKEAFLKVTVIDEMLLNHGYLMIKTNGDTDYLYYRARV